MLELHCHTTFSDGTLTPRKLVHTASQAGVRALAITDHDTISGWSEASEAATAASLEIIPGIEISTTHRGRSLHILGFYPCPEQLAPALDRQRETRRQRAYAMLERLDRLGYPVELEAIPSSVPGRTHIATALVKAGYVPSAQAAFERFLSEGGPAYVPYQKLSPVEAIALLRQCGAVPVWAHPYLFRGGTVEEVLPDLIEAGLIGLEAYHPSHSAAQIQKLRHLGERHRLLLTGGSDYHGPQIDARGNHSPTLNTFNLPLQLLEPIRQAARLLKP